jgi:hypothetical protein
MSALPPCVRGTMGAEILRLTVEAKAAAEQGRWDLVDECYRARGVAMQGALIAREDAERMLASDKQVQELALVAKSAAAELLRESQAVHLRLNRLRHGAEAIGTIDVEA